MGKKSKLDMAMVINGFSVGALVKMIEVVRLDVRRTSAYPKPERPHLLATAVAKRSALLLEQFYPMGYPIGDCKTPAEVDGILFTIEDFIAKIATIH